MFFELIFYSLKKSKTILDVDNDEFYSPAKFQPEIVCIRAYKKVLTNLKISEFAVFTTSDPEIFYFYTTQNTEYFGLVFCMLVQIIKSRILHASRNNHLVLQSTVY